MRYTNSPTHIHSSGITSNLHTCSVYIIHTGQTSGMAVREGERENVIKSLAVREAKMIHSCGGKFGDQQVKVTACCGVNTSSGFTISSQPMRPP